MSADRVDVLGVIRREMVRAGGEAYSDGRDLTAVLDVMVELIDKANQILSHNPAHFDTQEEAELRAALSRIAQQGDGDE